ncbi:hypothetical protein JCM8097_007870 [Rhodosporidiobolus ruineniae]
MARTRVPESSTTSSERRTSSRRRVPTTRARTPSPAPRTATTTSRGKSKRKTTTRSSRTAGQGGSVAAGVLAAVYTLSMRKKRGTTGVGHTSVQTRVLERHPTSKERVLQAKHQLVDEGYLEMGSHRVGLSQEALKEMREHKTRKAADSDDDEQAAANYLRSGTSAYKKTSRRRRAPQKTVTKKRARDYTSTEDEDESGEEVMPAQSTRTRRAEKKVKVVAPTVTEESGDEDEIDELESSADEAVAAASPPTKKRRRTTTSSGGGKGGKGSRGGLTNFTKPELLQEVKKLRAQLEGQEKAKGGAAASDDGNHEDVEQKMHALAEGHQHFEAKSRRYKQRLSRYEQVSDDEEDDVGERAASAGPVPQDDNPEEEYGGGMDDPFFDLDPLPAASASAELPQADSAATLQKRKKEKSPDFYIDIPPAGQQRQSASASASGSAVQQQQQQQPFRDGFGSPSYPRLDVDSAQNSPHQQQPLALDTSSPVRRSSSQTSHHSDLLSPLTSPQPRQPSAFDDGQLGSSGPADKGKQREATPLALAPTPGPSSSSPAKSALAAGVHDGEQQHEGEDEDVDSRQATTEPSSPVFPSGVFPPNEETEKAMRAMLDRLEAAEEEIGQLREGKSRAEKVNEGLRAELELVVHRFQDRTSDAFSPSTSFVALFKLVAMEAALEGARWSIDREVKLLGRLEEQERKAVALETKLAKSEADYEALLESSEETEEDRVATHRELDLLKSENAQLARFKDEHEKQAAQLRKAEKDAEEKEREVVQAKTELANVREQLNKLRSELDSAREDVELKTKEIEAHFAVHADVVAERQALTEQVERLTKDNGELRTEVEEAKHRLAEVTSSLDALRMAETTSAEQIKGLTAMTETLEGEKKALADQLEAAKKERETLTAETAALQASYDALSTRIHDLATSFSLAPSLPGNVPSTAELPAILDALSSRLHAHDEAAASYAAELASKDEELKASTEQAEQAGKELAEAKKAVELLAELRAALSGLVEVAGVGGDEGETVGEEMVGLVERVKAVWVERGEKVKAGEVKLKELEEKLLKETEQRQEKESTVVDLTSSLEDLKTRLADATTKLEQAQRAQRRISKAAEDLVKVAHLEQGVVESLVAVAETASADGAERNA